MQTPWRCTVLNLSGLLPIPVALSAEAMARIAENRLKALEKKRAREQQQLQQEQQQDISEPSNPEVCLHPTLICLEYSKG